MNSIKSPSEIFCEECYSRIKTIINSVELDDINEKQDVYDSTLSFLNEKKNLLRDLKMVSSFVQLVWTIVDFKLEDKSNKLKISNDINDMLNIMLELVEDEDIRFSTPLSRLHVYFTISSIYSLLKPTLNVIIAEQCYYESKEIIKYFEPRNINEKENIEDIFENIETVFLFRSHNWDNKKYVEIVDNSNDIPIQVLKNISKFKDNELNITSPVDNSNKRRNKRDIIKPLSDDSKLSDNKVNTNEKNNGKLEDNSEESSIPIATTEKPSQETDVIPATIKDNNQTNNNDNIQKKEINPSIILPYSTKKPINYPTIYRPVLLPPPKLTSTVNQPLNVDNIPVIIKKHNDSTKIPENDNFIEIKLKPLANLNRPRFDYI